MLYATTRSKNDVHTAYKVIHQDCAADGGLFVPLTMPKLDAKAISELKDHSCGQNMAQILNLFFACGMTGWDMDFTIGRNALQNFAVGNRLVIAELWHNSHWSFAHAVQSVSDRLRKEQIGQVPSNWVNMAVRIAALFGLYGMLLSAEQIDERMPLDIATASGDFAMPMAAWYAREMGLPIGNIICGCNANGNVWELFHRGQMNSAALAVKTSTPAGDLVIPRDLERLVYATMGMEETERYLECCRIGGMFKTHELLFDKLRDRFFASVNSDSRVMSTITNFYRSYSYVLSPYAALAFGSLSDYRSKTGESRMALLISESSPVRDDLVVAQAMHLSVPELEKLLNLA